LAHNYGDTLYGGDGSDHLFGDAGDDSLHGGNGSDVLMGGASNDSIFGNAGTDTAVFKSAFSDIKIARTATGFAVTDSLGTDILTSVERIGTDNGIFQFNAGTGSWSRVSWTSGVELADPSRVARGTARADIIDNSHTSFDAKTVSYGFAGNDRITGSGYSDLVFGGDGNDSISGWIPQGSGGFDDDRLYGQNGDDRIDGSGGSDRISGGNDRDILSGGSGDDRIYGGAHTDTAVYTGFFIDLEIIKTNTGWQVSGRDGTDQLQGVERIAADDGVFVFFNDVWNKISTKPGVAMLAPETVKYGTAGPDTFDLDFNPGIIFGQAGNDVIKSAYGTEHVVFGGAGDDEVTLYAGRAYGGIGNDKIVISSRSLIDGGEGDDIITGNGRIIGGSGNDTINGSAESDLLTGGSDADVFSFTTFWPQDRPPRGWGRDVITDFKVGEDHLQFLHTGSSPWSTGSTLTLTADGWLVSAALIQGDTSVLLKGVFEAGLTMDDLILA
jgi:Ca2+-binding RTX toxin-like protein